MKYIISLLFSLLLTGCFSPSFDNYAGYWTHPSKPSSVLEIKKDGEKFLLVERELSNNHEKINPLTKTDEQLILNTGFGNIPLTISENNNELYFQNKSFQRITSSKLEEMISFENEKTKESQKNSERCNSLWKEYQLLNSTDNREKESIVEKMKSTPNCRTPFILKKFN